MAEILEQAEIEALLAAAGVEPGQAPGPTPRFGRAGISPYDFKRPERVSKDHIRALGAIHEVFARNFGATLSGLLRTIIEVRVAAVEQLTYGEFIHTLPNPTCFLTVQASPLEGQMCMELSPQIVFPIIDRLLGGTSTEVFVPQRPVTSIEWRLVRRLVERGLEQLSEVWRNLVDARFQIMEMETNPQLVHIVAPTEVVVFITFEIRLGQHSGTMCLCIPFNVIESVLSRLTSQSWFYKPKAPSDVQRRNLLRGLSKSKVRLSAFLGQTALRLRDLRTLRPGDLIELPKRVGQELIVRVEGRNKFACTPGQYRGRRAVCITRHAAVDERL